MTEPSQTDGGGRTCAPLRGAAESAWHRPEQPEAPPQSSDGVARRAEAAAGEACGSQCADAPGDSTEAQGGAGAAEKTSGRGPGSSRDIRDGTVCIAKAGTRARGSSRGGVYVGRGRSGGHA